MPTARAAHQRARIEPGEYRATCTEIKPPELYRLHQRWYMRCDFAIHDDGAIISKYLNLGTGASANAQLGPRSDYYKLWTLAMGRKPEVNETMDPAKIKGVEFLVTVGDKEHKSGGENYSVVESLRREPERVSVPERVSNRAHEQPEHQSTGAQEQHEPVSNRANEPPELQVQPHPCEEFREIPPRGPERAALLKQYKAESPSKGGRYLKACLAEDGQAVAA